MVFSLRQQGILRFRVADFSPVRRKIGNTKKVFSVLLLPVFRPQGEKLVAKMISIA
jgi:hypothetical protein